MASNTGKNSRNGTVKKRSQTLNTTTNQWAKRDAITGRFMATKKDGEPFKGVTKEKKRKVLKHPMSDPAFARAARLAAKDVIEKRRSAR